MKYSEAIIIATIASAAIVSAAPARTGRKSTGIRRLASSMKRGGRSAFRGAGGITGAAEHAASIYGFWKQRKAQKAAQQAEASGEGPVARAIPEPAGNLPFSESTRIHRKNGLKTHQAHHPRGKDGKVHYLQKATGAKNLGSTIPAARDQPRDLFEFDELEMRNFALDELD